MKLKAVAVLACVAWLLAAPLAHARQPNIVFILADDIGYGDIGCYGQKQIQTPNIDRLAKEGMRFTNFYAGSTVCAPSRCVLMTGKDLGHAPVRGNGGGTGGAKGGEIIPQNVTTVAEMLKEQGYATTLIGKWGLGSVHSGSNPADRGFDQYFGFLSQVHAHNYYPEWLVKDGQRISLPGNELPTPKKADGSGVAIDKVTYAPDLFEKVAIEFIDQHKDKPFFLYFPTTIPHANDEATPRGSEVPSLGQYADKPWPENERGFAAMITLLDTQVGHIMDALKKKGLDDDTIVIFTSDNGPHSEGGHDAAFFQSAGPLRGIKRDLYEGGIREPMIVRWPGKTPAGKETDHIGYFGDFFATAAEVSGGKLPEDTQSISFVPTITGKSDQKQHDYLYWEFYERKSSQAVRFGNWKAVRIPMLTGKTELYDLATDLGEKDDVADKNPTIVAKADELMKQARALDPNWRAPSELQAGQKGDTGHSEQTLAEVQTDYRKYLDPRTLARINSLDLRARLIVEGLMTGMHRSPYQGASVEFAQHRPYTFGDDIRRVDWKVLGKTDRVYLKQYIEETNLHLINVVDASESMGYGTVKGRTEDSGLRSESKGGLLNSVLSPQSSALWTKYDHATAIAASLSYMAIQQQDSVGLAVFDRELKKYLKPSNSPGQWKTITQELTVVPRTAKTGMGHVLDQLAEKLTHRSLIVVLSDFFDDLAGIQQGLRHLRYKKHELMVFQVLDPMEIEFPFEDVTLFKGMEELGELLTEPRALREGYLEQLNQFTDELKRMCRGMHIDFTRMNSGDPLDVALSNFLATRSASMK